MFELVAPNIFIDLAMGVLLFGSIALFHMATWSVLVSGLDFVKYDRELLRILSESPIYTIQYVSPIIFHYVTAAVITAAVSNQIDVLDVFIISTIPITILYLLQRSPSLSNWNFIIGLLILFIGGLAGKSLMTFFAI
jgi:hypothetical protein